MQGVSKSYNKEEDKFFKMFFDEFDNIALENFGFNDEILYSYSEEQIQAPIKILRPDSMFQCENNISILAEFQSTIPTKEKLLTIIQYMVNDAIENKNSVKALILCTDIEKSKTIKVEIGPNHTLEFPLYTFKCHEGDEILNTIENKIKNNKEITEREEMFLTLIPFTNLKIALDDAMLKAAELTNQIKINQDRLDIMKSLQFISATKFASKEKQQQIKNVIQMNSSLFNSGIEQGIEIGMERGRFEGLEEGLERGKSDGIEIGLERGLEKGRFEGMEEGTISIAKRMLKDNSPIEKIMEYTRLSKKEIENIK